MDEKSIAVTSSHDTTFTLVKYEQLFMVFFFLVQYLRIIRQEELREKKNTAYILKFKNSGNNKIDNTRTK